MRFIIHGATLSHSLQAISGVIPSSRTMPILLNFLFELEGNTLTIKASDLETTASVRLELDTVEHTSVDRVAIPAKILLETVSNLSNQQLNISVKEDLSVEINAGVGKYKFLGESAESYPKAIDLENPQRSVISSSVLSKAITKTIFATGSEELRPQMGGVLCEQTTEGTVFVATDAHKLVKYTRTDCSVDENRSYILPKKPLTLLNKLLVSNKEDVDVVIDNNETNVRFDFCNYTLVSRLIDGKYPNYNAAIPSNNPNKLIIDRNMLYDSVKRVSVFASQTSNQVVFRLNGNKLLIYAQDTDMTTDAREELNCNYQGEEMEIGFNANYLTEMLNNVDTEMLLMEMSTPDRAGIIYPYNEQAEETQENILMLIMPVVLMN